MEGTSDAIRRDTSYERLRNDNCVYIDKTELIYRLASSAKACFLAVPDALERVC